MQIILHFKGIVNTLKVYFLFYYFLLKQEKFFLLKCVDNTNKPDYLFCINQNEKKIILSFFLKNQNYILRNKNGVLVKPDPHSGFYFELFNDFMGL